jgi:hypothetical protein
MQDGRRGAGKRRRMMQIEGGEGMEKTAPFFKFQYYFS